MPFVRPPTSEGPFINWPGYILIRRRIQLLLPALFIEHPLPFVPGQTEKFRHSPSLLFHVLNHVFVPRLDPGKAFPLLDSKPDIHQVAVMLGNAFKAQKVHVDRVERNILEITTKCHVARVPQRDDYPQFLLKCLDVKPSQDIYSGAGVFSRLLELGFQHLDK